MPNPNSADKRAKDKAAKAAEAAFLADLAEAEAKAAEAKADDDIGTAEKPVDASASVGATPSTHNLQAKWAEEISAIALKFKKNDLARLLVWREMGRKLGMIALKFVKYDDTGKPAKGKDGKVIKDNNAYSKWLDEAGLTKEELKNPNTRSAAIWIADNWDEVSKVPAAMKHSHPGHARDAFTVFQKALDKARDAYDGEDFDEGKFAADYEAPKPAAKGSTVPHTVATCERQFRAALASNRPGVTIYTLVAKGVNEFAALVTILREELSKAESEIATLRLDLTEAYAALDAAGLATTKSAKAAKARAKAEAKAAKAAPPKTENGDERVPGEVTLWEGNDAEADEINGDFEEVAPVSGLLPPPEDNGESL